MKITQSPKITNAFLKSMTQDHHGPLEIHLHMEANGNVEARGAQECAPKQSATDMENIIAYIDLLPPPRLENFMKHFFTEAVKEMGTQTAVARWLGIDRRRVMRKVPMKLIPQEEDGVEIR